MVRIDVIFHSVSGTTFRLAEAIGKGVTDVPRCQARLLLISEPNGSKPITMPGLEKRHHETMAKQTSLKLCPARFSMRPPKIHGQPLSDQDLTFSHPIIKASASVRESFVGSELLALGVLGEMLMARYRRTNGCDFFLLSRFCPIGTKSQSTAFGAHGKLQ